MAASASTSENSATINTTTPTPKLRSCAICRSRKVRCDKLLPCSNCRRANIACVFPSADRPLRWARRLECLANNAGASNPPTQQVIDPGVDKVMDRLRNLESLVEKLRGQLVQARVEAASSVDSGSSGVNSPGSPT